MPKSLPTPATSGDVWGTALNANLTQLMDPTTGGFNTVADVAQRDSLFWANGASNKDDFANKTVYVVSTGTFHVWTISTDVSNTRYWKELSKLYAHL